MYFWLATISLSTSYASIACKNRRIEQMLHVFYLVKRDGVLTLLADDSNSTIVIFVSFVEEQIKTI